MFDDLYQDVHIVFSFSFASCIGTRYLKRQKLKRYLKGLKKGFKKDLKGV
jgi:hypothetical protein